LSYSSVGDASQAHLAGELFTAMAGVDLIHVPYTTSTHAILDLDEGRIDMQFGILATSLALIRDGKLRALAVTTAQRIEELPNVPTMIEAGLPGYKVSLLFAVAMPAATPATIVTRLNREIDDIMAAPEVKQVLAVQAIHAVSTTPAQLRDRIAKEIELWRDVAQKAGIKPE
jgi:tripartite-type tricarboxylate transporter receptor subunit TctC